jgi:hypothetical protein
LAFAVFAGVAAWRGHAVAWKLLGALSVTLLFAGAVTPTILGPVRRGWMALAHLLSKVTTPLVMGIVYFLVLTPIALFMRAIGRRPLEHAEENGSYWLSTAAGGRSDMERQF